MTSVRRPNTQPHVPPLRVAPAGEGALDTTWPVALRALLLLSDAVHPGDPALARLSDEELALLRVAIARLNGAEPTSAA